MTGSAIILASYALCMLATGVGTMALRDYMDVNHFDFPIHWVFMTAVGYAMFLPIHWWASTGQQQLLPASNNASAAPSTFKVPAISMFLDGAAMSCAYLAMGVLSAAVVQMMRGVKLLITFCMSQYVMGETHTTTKRHYVAVAGSLAGLALVIAGSFLQDTSDHSSFGSMKHSTVDIVVALVLCVVSELFNSALFVYQEFASKTYNTPPLQLVGMMGAFGVLGLSIVLCLLNYWHVESSPQAWGMLVGFEYLALSVIFYMIFVSINMFTGIQVSILGSSVLRAILDMLRSALIWVVELSMGWIEFKILHLFGFTLIVASTALYNGLVTIPWLDSAETLPLSEKKSQTTGGRP
eukprot:gnl/TRDRNA2_/TRDRNA2_171904_c1_seq1.p1 gnl/TRDRNA2_/TRDRNA2_171904_c1~~gnl/TRDRNA2_/TRDRNA2_171904_c1_seq1.p1  ORF type:complete len:352 (-),score=49.88 gnl/TRDRNA2_/TRDRNA2_171904_c1_seq1:107-1162(-)